MPQFFVKSSNVHGKKCIINGDDFRHLTTVRRLKEGGRLTLRLDDGSICSAVVTEIRSTEMVAEILEKNLAGDEPISLTLCAGLLKGKNFDTVIKKASEIGVSRIIPVVTERVIPDLSGKEKGRLERWRKIAAEASKQSLRSRPPAIDGLASLEEVVKGAASDVKIIAHSGGKTGLREHLGRTEKNPDAALLVGPEGGFSKSEIELAENNGWAAVKFGFTCMRAETAALVLPAIMIYEWSIFDETDSERQAD